MTNRREFLALTSGLLAAHTLGVSSAGARSHVGLDILILGGTGFIGPHEIQFALEQGHKVTTFNRGRRKNRFGDQVETLIGNRDPDVDEGVNALTGKRTWDVVIDNSGYVPRHVKASVDLLKKRCGRYIYISTISVYDFDKASHFPEDGPLASPMDTEQITGESYGALKAECDLMVQRVMGDKATVVRPDFIVGPGDHTDRFTYWVNRVNLGGDMLAPSGQDQGCSWVDVRDLCAWLIKLSTKGVPGVFNASGPASRVTREGLLWGLRSLTPAPVTFHWPPDDFLKEASVQFPFCGLHQEYTVDNKASMKAGLSYRALAETALATQRWWDEQSTERRKSARGWLDPKKESELIQKLKLG